MTRTAAPPAQRTFMLGAVLGLVLFCATSCREKPPEAGGKTGARLTVAVIPKATTHSYWKAVEAGARQAGEEFDVQIEWQGPLDDSRVADQIGIFNHFAASAVSAIALAPSDDKALAPLVRRARRYGIPVVVFDSPLEGRQGEDYVNFVGTDNRAAGAAAARELTRLIGAPVHGGKVAVIRFTGGSSSTRLREESFAAELAGHSSLQIVAQPSTDGSLAGAQRVAESVLNGFIRNNQLELDGIFAPNQATSEGTCNALKALKARGVEVNTRFVAFDSSELLKQGLEHGIIQALIVQNPEKIGYQAVKSAVEALKKQRVEPMIDTGVTVQTTADVQP